MCLRKNTENEIFVFKYKIMKNSEEQKRSRNNWGKVFKCGPSKICGQPLKNFTWSILEYFAPIIDDKLNFKRHVKNLSKKAS